MTTRQSVTTTVKEYDAEGRLVKETTTVSEYDWPDATWTPNPVPNTSPPGWWQTQPYWISGGQISAPDTTHWMTINGEPVQVTFTHGLRLVQNAIGDDDDGAAGVRVPA